MVSTSLTTLISIDLDRNHEYQRNHCNNTRISLSCEEEEEEEEEEGEEQQQESE